MVTLLNNLKDKLEKHYDVFICSSSYEARCLSITNAIIGEIVFKHKLVSLSIPHKAMIAENLAQFERQGFSVVEINNTRQIDTVDNFIEQMNSALMANPNASFLIDISTFTRQTLLILLRLLRNILSKQNKIQFVYAPAKEYSIGLPYKEKWLTQGILEVNSVFGYSGIIRPSRNYHLIILMGFEVERAASLITAYEPSKISVGYARQNHSISDEHYLLNKEKFDELLIEFPNAEPFEFSCTNADDCKEDILKQVAKYNYNTVISPMNNKISTVSCALAAFDNDEIQLAIAIPAVYNYENYSIPGDSCYIFTIENFIKNG